MIQSKNPGWNSPAERLFTDVAKALDGAPQTSTKPHHQDSDGDSSGNSVSKKVAKGTIDRPRTRNHPDDGSGDTASHIKRRKVVQNSPGEAPGRVSLELIDADDETSERDSTQPIDTEGSGPERHVGKDGPQRNDGGEFPRGISLGTPEPSGKPADRSRFGHRF